VFLRQHLGIDTVAVDYAALSRNFRGC